MGDEEESREQHTSHIPCYIGYLLSGYVGGTSPPCSRPGNEGSWEQCTRKQNTRTFLHLCPLPLLASYQRQAVLCTQGVLLSQRARFSLPLQLACRAKTRSQHRPRSQTPTPPTLFAPRQRPRRTLAVCTALRTAQAQMTGGALVPGPACIAGECDKNDHAITAHTTAMSGQHKAHPLLPPAEQLQAGDRSSSLSLFRMSLSLPTPARTALGFVSKNASPSCRQLNRCSVTVRITYTTTHARMVHQVSGNLPGPNCEYSATAMLHTTRMRG